MQTRTTSGKQFVHCGKFTSLTPSQQKAWLQRRQAIEHLRADHGMGHCWLKGAVGDAPHTISCAAGYNLRSLLHAIARLSIGPAALCLVRIALLPAMTLQSAQAASSRAPITT